MTHTASDITCRVTVRPALRALMRARGGARTGEASAAVSAGDAARAAPDDGAERAWRLRRDGARPLAFEGRLALQRRTPLDAAGGWFEVSAFVTHDGGGAVHITRRQDDPDQPDHHMAALVRAPQDVDGVLQRYDPASSVPTPRALFDADLPPAEQLAAAHDYAEACAAARAAFAALVTPKATGRGDAYSPDED